MIKLFLIGHLGKDATVNVVNGNKVINFTVAHTDKYKDNQGANVEKTTWVDCSYWTDKTAIAPYLLKGTQVFIEGTPEARLFQRNDGTSGVSQTCRVHQIQLIGSKREGNNQGGNRPLNQGIPQHSSLHTTNGGPGYAQSNDDVADDLPF